jgi:cupin 2 domain-containing protein
MSRQPHQPQNLLADLPRLDQGEVFQALLECRNVRIERIVSAPLSEDRADITRYDQPQDEWVLLLDGEAVLELDGRRVGLAKGQHLFIPARTPHRVLSTSEEPRCLWLAVHIDTDPAGEG